ncbi:MAG TPA: MBL fold metallo-hydrolase [Lacipirellulaceae bacterium]|nr:MBL fold metallo-hydrolase [Lacipirellulaceae bacterium]
MKLVLLGSGGYFPNGRRHTACLLLPEAGVVLDAGSGMCRIGRYLATDRLDVFLTHAHLDHVAGLTYLMNVAPRDVVGRTIVRGQAAKLEAVKQHLFAEPIFPLAPPFRFEPLTGPCQLPLGGMLQSFPLEHPGGSIGFRLDWPGHTMAYVTDTTADTNASYVDIIRGVDLLVHEAYFTHDANDLPRVTGHSSLQSAAAVAAAAQVGQLVLVHINPQIEDDAAFDLQAARRIHPDIELGRDEMELQF